MSGRKILFDEKERAIFWPLEKVVPPIKKIIIIMFLNFTIQMYNFFLNNLYKLILFLILQKKINPFLSYKHLNTNEQKNRHKQS